MEVQAGQDAAGPQRAGDASSAANCESFNAIPYFDRSPLSAITPRDVANFIGWLCDGETQGRRLAEERRARRVAEREAPLGSVELGPIKPLVLADATVRRILAPLRACLATTVHEGLIRHNPTVGAVLPHRATVEEAGEAARVLTRAQLATFLRVLHPRFRLCSASSP
jgi:hypothetical protein